MSSPIDRRISSATLREFFHIEGRRLFVTVTIMFNDDDTTTPAADETVEETVEETDSAPEGTDAASTDEAAS